MHPLGRQRLVNVSPLEGLVLGMDILRLYANIIYTFHLIRSVRFVIVAIRVSLKENSWSEIVLLQEFRLSSQSQPLFTLNL